MSCKTPIDLQEKRMNTRDENVGNDHKRRSKTSKKGPKIYFVAQI